MRDVVGVRTPANDDSDGGHDKLSRLVSFLRLAQAVGGCQSTLGGSILLAVISAAAFAAILAVVAGLTLTSASSVAHHLYEGVQQAQASERSELIVARIAAFAIGAVAILLAIPHNA